MAYLPALTVLTIFHVLFRMNGLMRFPVPENEKASRSSAGCVSPLLRSQTDLSAATCSAFGMYGRFDRFCRLPSNYKFSKGCACQ